MSWAIILLLFIHSCHYLINITGAFLVLILCAIDIKVQWDNNITLTDSQIFTRLTIIILSIPMIVMYEFRLFQISITLHFILTILLIAIMLAIIPIRAILLRKPKLIRIIVEIILTSISITLVATMVIVNLNCRLPSKQISVEKCKVISMNNPHSRKHYSICLIHNLASDEYYQIKIPDGVYDNYNIGDIINKITYKGFLGIEFTTYE